MGTARLDKLLAQSGERSRSEAARLIRAGRVTVDGAVRTDPASKADAEQCEVCLDGQRIQDAPYQYLMLHKPAGILTAARDRSAQTVMDLLPKAMQARGVLPVGRLDKDTTGLLLFTSDGQLSHRLLSPKTHVWKEYLVTVDGALKEEHRALFSQGVPLKEFTALPAELLIISASPGESRAMVRLREGKFHQVKRMFAALSLQVTALHRQAFGPLTLHVPPGEYRMLRMDEIRALYRAAAMDGDTEHD
ncbi:MAG: rRNA pseudouridine synthase [Firmicutes bacterium]|nr:rRNA pseudouridine synthase [Bacillota bacterium]